MNKRVPLVALGLIAAGAIVLPIAYWLLSPLWIDRPVNEGFPTRAPVTVAAQAAEMMATAMAPPTQAREAATPGDAASAQVLLTGEFYDVIHEGRGAATIYELSDGARVLRLDPFEVLNGPDLHVYLVGDDPVPNKVGFDFAQSLDLGSLKGDSGAQNYPLPPGVNLSLYKSVVIWCQPFKVPFIAAALLPPEGNE